MNETTIKELLSVNYARVLAEFNDLSTAIPTIDTGDDMLVQKIKLTELDGVFKYFSTGSIIALQLKCTTEKSIQNSGGILKYPPQNKKLQSPHVQEEIMV